tara:strand:- start:1940 stop:2248 length:309 start_codon:yes stop_codon:yes gene_type:complete
MGQVVNEYGLTEEEQVQHEADYEKWCGETSMKFVEELTFTDNDLPKTKRTVRVGDWVFTLEEERPYQIEVLTAEGKLVAFGDDGASLDCSVWDVYHSEGTRI